MVRAGADAPPEVVRGVPPDPLPWWLDDELWEMELAGVLAANGRAIVAERVRLARRVSGWTDEARSSCFASYPGAVSSPPASAWAEDVGGDHGGGARPASPA